ncbi:hypothetical protein BGZ76_004709 [Entomortierella beljakovae]|nr:hypothetical protein BGZ76_004709 [Entomortierella beljakovae]
MKSFTAAAIATLALASHVSAQLISFSQPISSTVWTAGETGTVSWSNACADPASKNNTYPITLNYQVGQFQVQVPNTGHIGFVDCTKAGTTSVKVPLVPQGSTYSILVVNGAVQSYSAQFTINSSIPGNTTTGTTATATTTTAMTTTTAVTTSTTGTTSPSLTTVTSAPTTSVTGQPTNSNNAGALKAGSTAALFIVAAVASLML